VSEAVGEVYRRLVPDSLAARGYGSGMSAVDGYARLLEGPTAGIRATGAFEEPERWRFDWQQHVSRDEWHAGVPSLSRQQHVSRDEWLD
ncbi:hypothetical protein ACC691_39405, partial [Rhizobium johnstonii]|uniref:hypothetical protein n=1 Tax=Rhizobium johnstonii TaxID=3019933 RepID=UPI003F9918B5